MAIDYHDLTAIADTLKNVYGDGLKDQMEEEALTYNQFPMSERKPAGNGYVFGVRYARAQGVGARAESQLLPDPLVGKYDQATVVPKYIYGALRLTGPSIERAKGNVAAFVDNLADSVDDIYQSVKNSLNRQCWGDGFGLLATLSQASDNVTTSTTTWTVTADNNVGMMYCYEGQLVDFFNSTAIDQSASSSRISTIDLTNKTCEMEYNDGTYKANHPITAAQSYTITTATVASGSYMVAMGSREATHATSNTPVEMVGIDGIFDDGTLLASYEGITVASYPRWKANILSNSSVDRELTLDLMLQAVNLCRKRAGSTKRINIRMGDGQLRKYFALLSPDVRYAPQKLRGGFTTLTFAAGGGATEIIVDPLNQPGKVYFEPDGTIQKFELLPLSWGDMDGSKMHRRAGYDEWDLYLRTYTNLGVEQRNNLTVIKDLAEPNIWS